MYRFIAATTIPYINLQNIDYYALGIASLYNVDIKSEVRGHICSIQAAHTD